MMKMFYDSRQSTLNVLSVVWVWDSKQKRGSPTEFYIEFSGFTFALRRIAEVK